MNRRGFIEQVSWCLAVAGGVAQGATPGTYKETISNVLITEDSKKLVVMTNKYHYIFDASAAVVRTLKENFHPYVRATFSDFHISSSGKTVGTITLAMANAPEEALEEAIAAGFVRSRDSAAFTTRLKGKRYLAGGVEPIAQYKLNNSYEINMVSDQSESRTRITPIQVVGGVFVLAGVSLFALIVFGSCAVHGTLGTSACHE